MFRSLSDRMESLIETRDLNARQVVRCKNEANHYKTLAANESDPERRSGYENDAEWAIIMANGCAHSVGMFNDHIEHLRGEMQGLRKRKADGEVEEEGK